jgi:dUTP pyrophosphatase
VITYKKLYDGVESFIAPREGDAGYDVRAYGNYALPAWEWVTINTGLAIKIPEGYVGLVRGRSGLAFKENVFALHGTIDSSYRGELKLKMCYQPEHGWRDSMYIVKHGDKLAQIVFVPCLALGTQEVSELDTTERGEAGFGSTGK